MNLSCYYYIITIEHKNEGRKSFTVIQAYTAQDAITICNLGLRGTDANGLPAERIVAMECFDLKNKIHRDIVKNDHSANNLLKNVVFNYDRSIQCFTGNIG